MKKSALVLVFILVLILTIVIAVPVFADPGRGKACEHIWGSGNGHYGWGRNWDAGKGYGPMTQWIGNMQACLTSDTPKTPYFAGK